MSDEDLPVELQEEEDEVTCWVCFEIFNEPVTLHCAHSFCKSCVQDVATTASRQSSDPACPFCRRPFQLPLPAVSASVTAAAAAFKRKVEEFRAGGKSPSNDNSAPTAVEQDSPALWLPADVLRETLLYLNPRDVGRAEVVCRQWREHISSPLLWRSICLQHFPFCSVDRYGKDWKKAYAARSNVQKGWDGGKAGDFSMNPLRGHSAFVEDFDLFRGRVVSGSADGTVKVWKTDSKSPLLSMAEHEGPVHCVSFAEKIASGSADGTARLYDVRTGVQTSCLRAVAATASVAQGEAGLTHGVKTIQQLASGAIATGDTEGRVQLWDVRSGSAKPTHAFRHNSASVEQVLVLGDIPSSDDNNSGGSNSNAALVVARDNGGRIKVWDVRANAALHDLSLTTAVPSSSVFAPAAGGTSILIGCNDGQLFVTDAATGTPHAMSGARHYSRINDLYCNGTQAATAGEDGKVKIWDVRPGRRTLQHSMEEHNGPVHSVQFAAVPGTGADAAANSGKVVSSGADNTIRVWNLKRGTQMYALLGGSVARRRGNEASTEYPNKAGCTQVAFDDSRIVGTFGSMLRVYDFEVFKP